jgi:hypothetical protein
MVPTFIGMVIYAAVAAVIGLLVLRYGHWRPQPSRDVDVAADQSARGWGCSLALIAVVLIAIAALVYLWGLVGGRH